MASGQFSVTEAAHQVGYANCSYFISRFRQTYGYNPSKLKK
ncbi:helix-turn-helix domain-containing protein [Paenibacillus xylanivorans]